MAPSNCFSLCCVTAGTARVIPCRTGLFAPTGKPAIACGDPRSLTSFEYSVVSASVIAATAAAPEHPPGPDLHLARIEHRGQSADSVEWTRYMFGNGGWAGESFETPGRIAAAARALKAGFVTAATDTGPPWNPAPALHSTGRNCSISASGRTISRPKPRN